MCYDHLGNGSDDRRRLLVDHEGLKPLTTEQLPSKPLMNCPP